MFKIYAVKLRGSNKIYYIGQTRKSLVIRKNQHFSAARKGYKTKFYNWLRCVQFDVTFELLHTYDTLGECDKKEIELIKTTSNLKNLIPGGTRGPIRTKNRNGNSKKVAQYDLKGNLISTYHSMVEAQEKTGIKAAKISNCLSLERVKSGGGYMWKIYKTNPKKNISVYKKEIIGNKKNSVPVSKIKEGIITSWPSIKAAARETEYSKELIKYRLKKGKIYKGERWTRHNI